MFLVNKRGIQRHHNMQCAYIISYIIMITMAIQANRIDIESVFQNNALELLRESFIYG